MQSNLYNYKNVTEALRAIFRTEGMKGLFAGYGSTALRDAPFAGLYVLIYEHGKNTLKPFEATSNPYSGTFSYFLMPCLLVIRVFVADFPNCV